MANMRLAFILLPAMMITGCVKFGSKPPASLLSISSAERVAPGTTSTSGGGTITVLDPDVPKSIDTVRVAVQATDTSFAYVPKAAWVDTPRNMFRAILAETLAARGALVLDPGQYAADPGTRLAGELVRFGVDASTRQAVVTYDASLLGADGSIVKKRFSATAPVSAIDDMHVAAPIQAAANQVAGQVADWVKAGR